jgi:hypothetical protein
VWFSEVEAKSAQASRQELGDPRDRLPNSLTFGGQYQADEPWLSNNANRDLIRRENKGLRAEDPFGSVEQWGTWACSLHVRRPTCVRTSQLYRGNKSQPVQIASFPEDYQRNLWGTVTSFFGTKNRFRHPPKVAAGQNSGRPFSFGDKRLQKYWHFGQKCHGRFRQDLARPKTGPYPLSPGR